MQLSSERWRPIRSISSDRCTIHVVYRPAQMLVDELRIGLGGAYGSFYSTPSIVSRFPLRGKRHRAQWLIYNIFMRKGSQTEHIDSIAAPTAEPDVAPMPPILPVKREWRAAVVEATRGPGPHLSWSDGAITESCGSDARMKKAA